MAEKTVVGLIVAGAAIYLVWMFIKARKNKRCFGCQHIEYCERNDPCNHADEIKQGTEDSSGN